MSGQEIAFTFDCEGCQLIGMIHLPETVRSRGLLSIVAGGPQYRAGVARMQVQMGRALAAQGIPVMRFDYRGLGDSEGRFRGFRDVGPDIDAAIRAFLTRVPDVREVVLWGGCDAASAIMINAWKYPAVTGVVLGNPWVHAPETEDAVAIKHYGQRIKDPDFWRRLVRLQYNPFPAAGTLVRGAVTRATRAIAGGSAPVERPVADDPGAPFIPRMRLGLSRFKGQVLLLMSGRSLVSKEFDELVARDAQWQHALRSPVAVERHDIAEADQAFSDLATRLEVNNVVAQWMLSARPGR